MNPNSYRGWQFNLAGIRFWLVLFAVIWLLGSIGLGWIVKSVFILIGLLILAPIIGFWGFRWWLKRNLVVDQCPVCSYESAGINGTQMRCPSCGEPLQIEKGQFQRITPPGTVDVQAIDVSVKQIEES